MKKKYRIIISGGGTGGHIFPALSIADTIKTKYPDAEILFVGAENRMEMQRVPEAGYPIAGLPIMGFDRKNLLRNIKVLWKLFKSQIMAKKIIKNFSPQVVIGVGGYASGPTLKMAAKMNIPTIIQEQNSYAGVTNKLLAKYAKIICVAYEGMERFFPHEKLKITGNPVRATLLSNKKSREECAKSMNISPEKRNILILGGSLGARSMNESVMNSLHEIATNTDVQFIWQTGKYYYNEIINRIQEIGKPNNLIITYLISDMASELGAADLLISRAGAGSISEFALLEKAVILVPSPNVAEDHQTKNAMALVNNNAAILVNDNEAKDKLIPTALKVIHDQERLTTLSYNINKMARPKAAEEIAEEAIILADAYIEKETRRKKENLK